MRLAYVAAGAAGMYCGSCIHDNTLAAALMRRGVDVALIPTYTPIRTDEDSVSTGHIFYGGVNVYLQQKLGLFRHTPRMVDWLLDRRALLGLVSRFSAATSARDLGALTVSVLQGEEGHQAKELEKLTRWMADEFKPDVVQLTNTMFAGMARRLKEETGAPVLCAVQGEDLFLEQLVEPYRSEARRILSLRARDVDGFIAPCRDYADFMAAYLEVPAGRFHVVRLGLNLEGHGRSEPRAGGTPFTVGYLARLSPEKGLHVLAEAFQLLAERRGKGRVRLEVAGWLGAADRRYFREVVRHLERAGLADSFRYRGEVDRQQKIAFLNELHVLSVPAQYREPKGLYILEALANGVPVVQPRLGAYPELVEATAGGLLVEAGSAPALADGIEELMEEEERRLELGRAGMAAVHAEFGDDAMAATTLALYRQYGENGRPRT